MVEAAEFCESEYEMRAAAALYDDSEYLMEPKKRAEALLAAVAAIADEMGDTK